MPIKKIKPALRQLIGQNHLVGAEIGIGEGAHASFYLSVLDIDVIFLIDPYIVYENERIIVSEEGIKKREKEAHIKLAEYKHKITWIKEKSTDAAELIADNSLDFVYIDGNHAYEFVTKDISLYYPKVKEGGLFSGHDYNYESVKKAVNEFVNKQKLKLHTEHYANGKKNFDWWIWKTGDM